MTNLRGGVLLLVLVGCGGGSSARGPSTSTAPAERAPDPDAPELEILERFQTLADYVDRSRGQCERLATSIDSWMDANSKEVGSLIERSRAEPGLEGRHLTRVEGRLEDVMGAVIDAVQTCKGVATVEAAFAKLDGWVEST